MLYLTFDNVGVGRTIAEVIYDLVPTGNYVIIKGNSADANADFLREGMEEVIGDAVGPATSPSSARRTPTTGTRRSPRPRWNSS